MERVIYTPPGGPPQGPGPNSAIYKMMGEANIFRMMSDFYKELEKSDIRRLFPPDMEEASKKSAMFFVGLLGGPPLYLQKYGSPRMRARHLPFEIDEKARRPRLPGSRGGGGGVRPRPGTGWVGAGKNVHPPAIFFVKNAGSGYES